MEPALSAAPVERLVRLLRFTDTNVAAIRNGRKTQTRRPLKPQPTVPDEFMTIGHWGESWATVDERQPDDGVVDEWFSFRVGETLRVVLPDDADTGLMIRIENVRAERLHTIDDAGALAEGVGNQRQRESTQWDGKWVSWFRELWGTIYGPEHAFAWGRNPWVFVYEFSVLS